MSLLKSKRMWTRFILRSGLRPPLRKDLAGQPYHDIVLNTSHSTWARKSTVGNPLSYFDLEKVGHGSLFKETKGFIVADFKTRTVIPYGKESDMSYFNAQNINIPEKTVSSFGEEWTDACKTDLKTSCNFDYSGIMIEQHLLGSVAFDVGKKLEYNAEKMEFTNSPEANLLLRSEYRSGWVLNG